MIFACQFASPRKLFYFKTHLRLSMTADNEYDEILL